MPSVEFVVSTHFSRFGGYQSKHGTEGTLKLFLPSLWKYARGEFNSFVAEISYTILLERICLERAFQKIRMKNRCDPKPCKIEQLVKIMYEQSGDWMVVSEGLLDQVKK